MLFRDARREYEQVQAGPQTKQIIAVPAFLKQHGHKVAALTFWLLFLGGYGFYSYQNSLSPLAAVQLLVDILANSRYGPLIFLAVYALRPLLFFSAILLTMAAGFLFGPVWGILYAVLGSNLSAIIAYVVARFFGQETIEPEESDGFVARYAKRMRENSFETILIMRFIFLPYDLVNYLAGFLRIDWQAFILATFLGSIPGTISFVLFGASIEGDFGGGMPALNPWVLATSAAIFIASLALSRYFKRRERVVSA